MAERPEASLCTRDGALIPLRAVDVVGEVVAGCAHIRVRQRYENRAERPLEAIYTFPLPSGATLVGFVMECSGRRLEGLVQERDEAFRSYDEALLAGHGAALLDQERADIFSANVGNLLPGETTVVEVAYLQRLHAQDGALRMTIPTLVAPRYIPGAPAGMRSGHGVSAPTARVPDADRISPDIGAADYTVSLDLTLRVGPQVEVSSPSHRLASTAAQEGVRVTFAEGREPLDRDLVIVVSGVEASELTALVAHKDGETGTFALSHVPDLAGAAFAPRAGRLELVFVLDRSGSMGGSAIEEARRALRLCLRQLREGDRFSILAFDDRVEAFCPEPVPFTQKTLEQADAWLTSLHARGGTELLAPLVRALELASAGAAAREGCVVLLTDGEVGNEDELLAAALEKSGQTRIYGFGIGTNVSDALLAELARRTGGGLELIYPGERIDEKVVATFARAIAPRVRDVQLKWDDLEVHELVPAKVPDLVDGEPWVVWGRYARSANGKIEIRGTLDGEPWSRALTVSLPASGQAPVLPKLWAAERVRELEAMGVSRRRVAAMKERIIALAKEHGIASRYTSFVVVETRSGKRSVREAAEARPIPVHAPRGWALFDPKPAMPVPLGAPLLAPAPSAWPFSPPMPPTMIAASAEPVALMSGALSFDAKLDAGAVRPRDVQASEDVSFALRASRQAAPVPASTPAFSLLSRQLASGLWDADEREHRADNRERDEDLRRLRASARALLQLSELGIDAVHPQYGRQVHKAISALVPLAIAWISRAPDLAELALLAAWLAAPSKRMRSALRGMLAGVDLQGLILHFDDDASLYERARALDPS